MDDMTSLADAIAPTPAPASAPAPTPAPDRTPMPAPQPVGAGTVNPYVPPAMPPQNLQAGAPPESDPARMAPPAPDPGQPPTPPAQQGDEGQQPAQPQIPQEYLDAHEWRGKIGEEAQAFGGLDMVPQALKWSRMLFGLEQPPDGLTPAGYFMETLFKADPVVYRDILGEVVSAHADRLLPMIEDQVLARHEIPKDRLPEIKDFLRYGRVSVDDSTRREFVQNLAPDVQAIFPRLTPAQQNFYVDQVDRGLMSWEFAEAEIREKGILLAINEREAQQKAETAEREKFESERRARHVANEAIGRYEKTFVEAYARKHGIAPEDVHEKVVFVAGLLDNAAAQDERHPAREAWDKLLEAAASGNELRINAAMNRMRVVFEQAFDEYMARRGKAPANGHQPPAQPQQPQQRGPQQPQFEPDKPNAGVDWSNISLDDYLFGRAPAQ